LQTAATVKDRADLATAYIFAAVGDYLRKRWESRDGTVNGRELRTECANYLRDQFADVARQTRNDLPPVD
jgi:hypothetical protein